MMTDTTVTSQLLKGYSNLITIPTLQAVANEAMRDVPLPMPTEEEPKLVGKCPDCGNAMTVRKSKKGKVYYSCSGYPTCKFMSWDIPTGDKCPQCDGALVKTARGNVKCSNKDCSYRIKTPKSERAQAEDNAPEFVSSFEAPPLMDEPYEGNGGFIFTGYDDE